MLHKSKIKLSCHNWDSKKTLKPWRSLLNKRAAYTIEVAVNFVDREPPQKLEWSCQKLWTIFINNHITFLSLVKNFTIKQCTVVYEVPIVTRLKWLICVQWCKACNSHQIVCEKKLSYFNKAPSWTELISCQWKQVNWYH